MRIDLSKIIQLERKTEEQSVSLDLTKISSQLGDFPIVEKTPFHLKMTNTGNQKLTVSANGSITVMIPCDRCLEDVKTVFDLNTERKLDMRQSEQERVEDLDESSFVTGTELDFDRLVYDEVLTQWPLKVLCKEDCKGICSQCGANLNRETCSCEHEERLDPRMAAINDIFSKFKEV